MRSMEKATKIEKPTTALDVLADGRWHPIISGYRIALAEEATSFWISEEPEEIGQPIDQSDADCYQINFSPSSRRWLCVGNESFAKGEITVMDGTVLPAEICCTYDERGYVKLIEV